jgi:hypothetical protein
MFIYRSYFQRMLTVFAHLAGASFGYMGIANVGASSGATCAIATDVPTEGFTGGSSYTITVPRQKMLVSCLVRLPQEWNICPYFSISSHF